MKQLVVTLAFCSIAPLALQADPLGFVSSDTQFKIGTGENVRSVYDKSSVNSGDTVSAMESNVQFYGSDSKTQILAGTNSSITVGEKNQYELHQGSVVISAPGYTIATTAGPVVTADNELTLTSVNIFSENEVSVQAIQGTVRITSPDGSLIAEVSDEQSIVLNAGENSKWSIAPEQTGAPSIFPFLAQVDDEGGSAVEEDDEDRRRFLILGLPLVVVGGAAAAAAVGGGIIIEDKVVNDDDGGGDGGGGDDPFIFVPLPETQVKSSNTVFTSQ